MSYTLAITEDLRLVLLRTLAEAPEYRANSAILQTAANTLGHAVSRDRIETELSWLAEQALATIESLGGGVVLVARATQRGFDVASGRAVVPGVKRPGP